MHNQINEPNHELLAVLKEAREEEHSAEGGVPTGTVTVSLDLDERQVAIREEWLFEIDDEQRAWLTVFAGVCSVLRYAARFPAIEFSSTVRRISQGRAARITDWTHCEEVDHEDVWFEVEILGAPSQMAPGGYLLMSVPDDLTEMQMLEPVAFLRTYLLNHHDPKVAFASSLAFETLASLAGRGELRALALDDGLALQIETPAAVMRVIEESRRVAAYLSGHEDEEGAQC